MDPSGIVQTVDAAFGCASVAYNLYIFLRRAQNADKTAAEGAEKIKQAHDVLNHIGKILEDRRDEMLDADEDTYGAVLRTIDETIGASNRIFNRIKSKLGVLDESQAGPSIVARIRVAYNHNALGRLNGDLEAIVNILQTSLTVLLLFILGQT
ncbi:hypothetical protein K431DRAFT_76534 [Polychaeton citri CBS 116435]|uniref:Uncharacterized protein n=1 Tax=Polychaeton citri CBS 116435 TaxID=1314669 RepID=A0A9P4UNV7_9PEZI|nr:hypothetical protein K431DRAFT_76534 [Polychaeton citri CBS 116435]